MLRMKSKFYNHQIITERIGFCVLKISSLKDFKFSIKTFKSTQFSWPSASSPKRRAVLTWPSSVYTKRRCHR